MNNEILRKSLLRSIFLLAADETCCDNYDEKEHRIRAMMKTYLVITL